MLKHNVLTIQLLCFLVYFFNFGSIVKIKHIQRHLFVVLFCVVFLKINATHLVGGELFYDYLGNNKYRIHLKLYRDCINGQPNFGGLGDGEAILNITGSNNEGVMQVILGKPVVSRVTGNANDPCISSPAGICVEVGIYAKEVTLPPRPGGYFLVYETCCRNNTILNIINPDAQGATYKAFIPGPELAEVNSSPRFNQYPSLFICHGKEINFNHSAIDPDGDSLVYSLCEAPNGFNTNTLVPYKAPYTGASPISANPALTIDNNGVINGVPNLIGQWVICVQVKEYRNGKLLDAHYRDFQYNVISCNIIIKSAIAEQTKKCYGTTLTFTNQSYSNFDMHYFWDFGDPNTITDTSYAQHPTHTFADTGKYEVTLIVNPGLSCADSIKKTVYVYPTFDVGFNVPNKIQCIKNNTVHFSISGVYNQDAVFNSYFGNNPVSHETVNDVVFTEPGKYVYKLYAKQYVCIDSLIDSLEFLDRPILKINPFPEKLCAPVNLLFSNGSYSSYETNYLWEINENAIYIQNEPTHTFNAAGLYTVALTAIRGGVCPDTVKSKIDTINVYPTPTADFILSSSVTSIFDSEIEVTNNSTNDATQFLYDFGDGSFSHYMNEKHVYALPGSYTITQTVKNSFECESTAQQEIIILPEFRLWVPNAFTPDENGLNDQFKPILIGASNYTFYIFNKSGQVVFSTNNINEGWNGFYKGQVCKQDVYAWKITYTSDVSQKEETKSGHVTLLTQTH